MDFIAKLSSTVYIYMALVPPLSWAFFMLKFITNQKHFPEND